MEIKGEQQHLETPFLSPQEEIERLRDELFWTTERAIQAEEDAARWLERLCDLEDQIEWQRYGPKKKVDLDGPSGRDGDHWSP